MKNFPLKELFKNSKRIIKLVWETDKTMSFFLLAQLVITALLPIVISYSFKLAIDAVVIAQNGAMIVTTSLISLFAFRYLMILFSDLGNTFLNEYLQRVFQTKFENKISLKFAERISNLDIPHFENSETQNLIQKAGQAYPWRLVNFYNFLFGSVRFLFTMVGALVVLTPFGFWIPLVMMLVTTPRFIYRNKYIKASWNKYNQSIEESKELGYVKGILGDPYTIKEVRVAQAEGALLKRLNGLQEFIFKAFFAPLKNYLPGLLGSIVLEALVFFFFVYLKLPDVTAKIITLGTFTFYLQMLDRVSSSLSSFAGQLSYLLEQNLYVGYFFDALELPKIIKEKVPGYEFSEIKPPKIEFKNVSFGYDGGPLILKNVSFALEPGEHLAMVGPNGAGKTTIVRLLLRFYDPTEGQIFVNGIDLKDLSLANYYKFISILFQDFVKFQLAIKDNILLGDSSLIVEKKMKDAAEKSGASEFIEKFPKKYNQRLGKRFDDSVELSHGQWQKLALARAFYESAPVLVLDEPTSAIDAEAEAQIFENLYKFYDNKSLILVSHRFSTVRNADKIIVLEHGEIAEEGTHETLMKKKNGIYARVFKLQAKGYAD